VRLRGRGGVVVINLGPTPFVLFPAEVVAAAAAVTAETNGGGDVDVGCGEGGGGCCAFLAISLNSRQESKNVSFFFFPSIKKN
jgi:hypothetical protein